MFYIVLLAMVAGFLAMRLYSVLGKRTGHEQALPKPAEERVGTPGLPRTVDVPVESREIGVRNVEPRAESGLRAIAAAEPGFDAQRFLEGAQAAYRMILEAFWRGDDAELADLVEDGVLGSFRQAISARAEAGHVLENRLVSIERATISDAALDGRIARITVRFDADVAAVTRDGTGAVVAGSTSDAIETHDIWTFARTVKSPDPNWKLSETDEA